MINKALTCHIDTKCNAELTVKVLINPKLDQRLQLRYELKADFLPPRRKEGAMKAAVVFTGTGPILILTSLDVLDDPDLVSRMAAKGIGKFIAHEIPVDQVRRWYGSTFDRVIEIEDVFGIFFISPCRFDNEVLQLTNESKVVTTTSLTVQEVLTEYP